MRRDDSDRLFDKRVVRRNIASGRISKDDEQRYNDALPDLTEMIRPSEEGGDDDGFDGSTPGEDAPDAGEDEAVAAGGEFGTEPPAAGGSEFAGGDPAGGAAAPPAAATPAAAPFGEAPAAPPPSPEPAPSQSFGGAPPVSPPSDGSGSGDDGP